MILKLRASDIDMRDTLELLTMDINILVMEIELMDYDFNRCLNNLGFYEVSTTSRIKTYKRL